MRVPEVPIFGRPVRKIGHWGRGATKLALAGSGAGIESKNWNFRRAGPTDWNDDSADAAADVNPSASVEIPANVEASASLMLAAHAFEEWQPDLAAVSVSGEDEVNGKESGGSDDAGVVREKNDGAAAGDAREGAREIGVVPEVVHTGDVEQRGASADGGMAVAQNVDAVAAEGAGDEIGADAEIVIAENGEDAAAGAKTAKKLASRVGEIAGIGDEVAGEGDHVRFERIGELDGGEQGFRGKIQAVMNVGEVNDAETVQLAAESGDGNAKFVDFDAASFPAAFVAGTAGGEVEAEIVEIAAVEAVEPTLKRAFAGLREDGREDGTGG